MLAHLYQSNNLHYQFCTDSVQSLSEGNLVLEVVKSMQACYGVLSVTQSLKVLPLTLKIECSSPSSGIVWPVH